MTVSCKGREMTESELLDFAHRYLKEMGYAEPGQPWLIYAHHDTRQHPTCTSSPRVSPPDGRKIAYSHERRRSQEVIDRDSRHGQQKKIADDMDAARQYTFSSFAQFKAIMVSMGYEVYKKDENVFIKHGGKVQRQIPLAEVEQLFKSGYRGTRPLPPAAEHPQKIPGRERRQGRAAERAEGEVRHRPRVLRQEGCAPTAT